MPRKPQRPCRYPGCPRLTDGVYCEDHAKIMEQHYEKFQRGYSPGKRYGRAWKRIRDRYIHKHPLCEQCLKGGRYVTVEEVHHIVPLSEGGSNDESNLMSFVVRVTRRFTASVATGRAVKISTTLLPGKRRGVFYAKIAIQTGY